MIAHLQDLNFWISCTEEILKQMPNLQKQNLWITAVFSFP